MNFSFNAKTYRDLLHSTVAEYFEDESFSSEELASLRQMVSAMDQAVDVMARASADSALQKNMSAESMGLLEEKDISKIGQYALDLLEGVVSLVHKKTGEQKRDLLRLSIPVSLWVARHGGKLSQIDMLVNSLAGYANEVTDLQVLADLAKIFREIINACDELIRADLEQTNAMRPWRILNLNYAIIATRSHQPALIEQAYDILVKNLPKDARQFFNEGRLQMDRVGYPAEVREVVERYNRTWGSDKMLH